jgi:hypothetical protein
LLNPIVGLDQPRDNVGAFYGHAAASLVHFTAAVCQEAVVVVRQLVVQLPALGTISARLKCRVRVRGRCRLRESDR